MPVDPNRPGRLIDHSYRESPAHEPHFLQEVAFPPIAAAIATYLVVSAAYGRSAGGAAAGVMMLIVLGWRLWRFDANGRGLHIVEHTSYKEDDSEPRREWAPVVRDNGDDGNGGHRWRIGNWYWSQSEWQRLAEALQGGSITRPALESVYLDNGQRMFPNASGRLNEYKRIFRQMGWADESDALTPAARAWMRERGLPLPPDNVGADASR